MVHTRWDPNTTGLITQSQSGEGVFEFHEGPRFQRGFGYRRQVGRGLIGNVFSRAWRFLVPMVKKAAEYVKPMASDALSALAVQGAMSGSKALGEIAKGKKVKEAVKTEGTEALRQLVRKAGQRLQQEGSGSALPPGIGDHQQQGKGRHRGRKKRSLSNLHFVGRSVLESSAKKKRGGRTAFTPY